MSETVEKPEADEHEQVSPEGETDSGTPQEEPAEAPESPDDAEAAGEETQDEPGAPADADLPSEDGEEAEPAPSIAPKKRSFSPVGWLALLLSLAALAGVGWLWITMPEIPQSESATRASVDSLNRSLASAEESLNAVQDRIARLADGESARAAEIAALERQLQSRMQAIESVPGRLSNLEGSMSALAGISSGVRDTWMIAEAEYYMQIANAQLQLAGNPHLASLALRLADEKVQQLANPALTNVRRAIAMELREIDSMERPDIEGITLTLASLAAVVDALPLRLDDTISGAGDAEPDAELSGLDRALASLKGAMGSVVSVRQLDEAQRPFVAPDAEYFLRANLSLQLQAARLALLRGEKAVFEQSIDDAAAWLSAYYDTDSTAVQSAQQTVDEIRGGLTTITPPDISESLRLLRQYESLTEYGAEPPAEPLLEPLPES